MCSHVYGELAVTETGRCAWEIHQEIMTLIFHFYYFFVWPCRIRFMFYCRNKWQWAETIAKRNKSIENGANSTITLSRSRIFPYQARLVMMIATHTYNENFTRRGCRSIKWSYRFYWIWTAQSSVMFVITLLPSAQLIIHIYEPETATRIQCSCFFYITCPLAEQSRNASHTHSHSIQINSIPICWHCPTTCVCINERPRLQWGICDLSCSVTFWNDSSNNNWHCSKLSGLSIMSRTNKKMHMIHTKLLNWSWSIDILRCFMR